MNVFILSSFLLRLSITSAFVPSSYGGSHHRILQTSNTRLSVFGDDHFDMDELKQRISQETVPQLFACLTSKRPEQVHVILFNPHTEQEGMHTIEYPRGSGTNVILAFEDSNDCDAFSENLVRQQFHDPTVSIRSE
jgi:hypothetical protein